MAGPSAGACVALIGVLMFNFNAAIKTGESCVNIKPDPRSPWNTNLHLAPRAARREKSSPVYSRGSRCAPRRAGDHRRSTVNCLPATNTRIYHGQRIITIKLVASVRVPAANDQFVAL